MDEGAKFRLTIGDKVITNDPTDQERKHMEEAAGEADMTITTLTTAGWPDDVEAKIVSTIEHQDNYTDEDGPFVEVDARIINVVTGEMTVIEGKRIPFKEWKREREEAERLKRENAELKKALKKRGKLGPIATEDGYLRLPADRLTKALIETQMPNAIKPREDIGPALDALEARGPMPTFWAAHTFETSSKKSGDLYGAIGYMENPGEALWDAIRKNGALAIKMQYVLWARAYAETDAEPGQFIRMSINQLCDDLGYKRKKGAHKRENKREAGQFFEALMKQQMAAYYTAPNGRTARLRGPIWSRGLTGDEYEDLYGANQIGDPQAWIPSALSYAPGDWFNEPTWRASNRYVALAGEGLLKLTSENKDKYALMIGGYLAILARMNGYRRSAIKAKTLLEKSGLWAADAKMHPGRMIGKMGTALDRLVEVEVIKCWQYKTADDPAIDYDNLDDPDTLAALADDGADPKERNRTIIIEWPDKLAELGERNEARGHKRKLEARRGRSRKQKPAQK